MKEKTDRNQRLYEYWLKNKGNQSIADIARVFHLKSRQLAWNIINRTERQKAVQNAK